MLQEQNSSLYAFDLLVSTKMCLWLKRGFVDLHQLDASSLANATLRFLNELHHDTMRYVSQCYDGASIMSGHLAGIQAIVKQSIWT